MIENSRISRISYASAAAESSETAHSGGPGDAPTVSERAAARAIDAPSASVVAGERYEGNREQLARLHGSIVTLLDQQQMLREKRRSHGDHHPAARLELAHERRGHVARGCSDDDRVERPAFLPAVIAVADFRPHAIKAQRLQTLRRRERERLDDLDRAHGAHELGKDCRLVPGTRADFK